VTSSCDAEVSEEDNHCNKHGEDLFGALASASNDDGVEVFQRDENRDTVVDDLDSSSVGVLVTFALGSRNFSFAGE
jgi:hypothetical protein